MSTSSQQNLEAYFDSQIAPEELDDEDEVDSLVSEEETGENDDELHTAEVARADNNYIPHIRITPIVGSFNETEILFRELMRDHQKRLYRFVIRYIDHPDDAADITQQAFVEAARTISSFRGDSKLSTWLYGIAMNMVRNYMRKMIEQDLYELPVLSYQELTTEVNIQPLARVEI